MSVQKIIDFLLPGFWGITQDRIHEEWELSENWDGGIDILIRRPKRIPLFTKAELEDKSYLKTFGPRLDEIIKGEKT